MNPDKKYMSESNLGDDIKFVPPAFIYKGPYKELNFNENTRNLDLFPSKTGFPELCHYSDELDDSLEAIVFSMRGVPSIDDSGIHEFFDIVDRLKAQNCIIKFSGVQEEVMIQFKRNHFDEYVGKESFCWDAIMALEALDQELISA